MLIRRAEIDGSRIADVRIEGNRVDAIGALDARVDEAVIDANGGALLPGLADHHLHLFSLAAALESVMCGPPAVRSAEALVAALRGHRTRPHDTWIRGVGYHDSVAGEIDRHWLDRVVADRPVRVQHRSGRLWVLNTPALDALGDAALARGDGRLFDQDWLLRARLGSRPPSLHAASQRLAGYGVTSVTDMTPNNDRETISLFAAATAAGQLLQRIVVAGSSALHRAAGTTRVAVGPRKVHLHESSLPPFDELCTIVRDSHLHDRAVAIHCVTETELVFALAALREAKPRAGDRIEHASVATRELVAQMYELGVTVVTQPNFVAERGDAYITDVPAADQESLYRARSLLAAGIPLAGGTDAPFGHADPWRAMQAAVTRTTAEGQVLGAHERLTPERALGLYLGTANEPACPRRVTVGAMADLCLLDRPWRKARVDLTSAAVRATLCDGTPIFDRVHQTPS